MRLGCYATWPARLLTVRLVTSFSFDQLSVFWSYDVHRVKLNHHDESLCERRFRSNTQTDRQTVGHTHTHQIDCSTWTTETVDVTALNRNVLTASLTMYRTPNSIIARVVTCTAAAAEVAAGVIEKNTPSLCTRHLLR